MAETEKKYPLRLPSGIYDAIAEMADEDRRSVNAEIVVLLEEAIAARKAEQRTAS